jgi:hypothetical protein
MTQFKVSSGLQAGKDRNFSVARPDGGIRAQDRGRGSCNPAGNVTMFALRAANAELVRRFHAAGLLAEERVKACRGQ